MRIRPFRYNPSPEISVIEYACTFCCFLILILVITTGNFECSSCNMGYLNSVLQSSSQVHAEYGPVSGGGLRFLPFLPPSFIILCLDLEFLRLLLFLCLLCKLLLIQFHIVQSNTRVLFFTPLSDFYSSIRFLLLFIFCMNFH
ncbi:hypothetical protein PVK06_020150 [Gossypium arboreum]|uniref:Uncharacterized protein n=1 Tax=Gossypium arboreum TaxID=29729 RepID=A0ABR0PLP7_GOSAR|nr:hypothetical protein PVK06_020150 [Gossypium arboreum]